MAYQNTHSEKASLKRHLKNFSHCFSERMFTEACVIANRSIRLLLIYVLHHLSFRTKNRNSSVTLFCICVFHCLRRCRRCTRSICDALLACLFVHTPPPIPRRLRCNLSFLFALFLARALVSLPLLTAQLPGIPRDAHRLAAFGRRHLSSAFSVWNFFTL